MFNSGVQSRLLKLLPCWITLGVVALVCLVRALLPVFPAFDVLEQLELVTYDWRARLALAAHPVIADNLCLVYVDEDSISELNSEEEGRYTWPWPRSVFGRVVHELKAQGAAAIGLDFLFFELDRDYAEDRVDGLSSDVFFARELAAARNVVLTTSPESLTRDGLRLKPIPDLFRTNAWAVGHDGIRGRGEQDRGVLRKVPAFVTDPDTGRRVWHMGLLVAAKAMGIDLDQAQVRPGEIILTPRTGGQRRIPVDARNRFYIDWQIGPSTAAQDERILDGPISRFYHDSLRHEGQALARSNLTGRVVLLGYAGTGQKYSDWGPTPVSEQTPMFLSQANVANSLLTGRFIQRAGWPTEIALVFALAGLSAVLGWRLRTVWGLFATILVAGLYLALAVWLYVRYRYWLPVVLPLFGSLAMTHVCLLSYRLVLERSERQRVRKAFSHVVSPNVFNLLLQKSVATLGGTRREVSIYFADVRGFTRFVEESHARTLARLREEHLRGAAAEEITDTESRETLDTVNLYLGKMADLVKSFDGTLDKYIGDCVMAFWGAPIPDAGHPLAAVKAAIAVHKTVYALNQERALENERRQRENTARAAAGQPPLPLLAILKVGSAINSGPATVGFMGSAAHISNYTVFGREVNIASRLEHLAGPDRILIAEGTFLAVRRRAPELAATFIKLAPVSLEGIPEAVQAYEVPWELPDPPEVYSHSASATA